MKSKKLTEYREEELECPCGKNQNDKKGGRKNSKSTERQHEKRYIL
jgi:hypothetical protein